MKHLPACLVRWPRAETDRVGETHGDWHLCVKDRAHFLPRHECACGMKASHEEVVSLLKTPPWTRPPIGAVMESVDE